MALDFPNAPTLGQVYDKWTWDGSTWIIAPGGSILGSAVKVRYAAASPITTGFTNVPFATSGNLASPPADYFIDSSGGFLSFYRPGAYAVGYNLTYKTTVLGAPFSSHVDIGIYAYTAGNTQTNQIRHQSPSYATYNTSSAASIFIMEAGGFLVTTVAHNVPGSPVVTIASGEMYANLIG